jgi:hypothetical protein
MIDFQDLPSNWSVRRFDDVLAIRKGNVNPALAPDEAFDLFSIPAFDESQQPEEKRGREIGSSKVLIRPGDCLFSKLNPRIPRTWVVPEADSRRQIASTEFWPLHSRFKTDEEGYLAPEILQWLFRCTEFLDEFRGEVSGGVQSRQRLQQDSIRNVLIPVPPLAEQRRLVARIEALTSRLEQARQARQAALAGADALRHALWDRIFAEVPEEFWQPIGTHAKIQGGYAFKSSWFTTSGIRLLRNQNVYHGTLEWSDTVHLPLERRGEFATYEMNVGDVVISMDRPLISTGLKAARIRSEDLPCLLLQRVGRFQFKTGLFPDYLFHFLSSQSFMIHISGDGRSSAVPHISAKQIEGIRIPVPKLAEQRRIVAQLDALAAKQTELRRLQTETEAELAAFTPALLAKAFRGEL